MLKERLKETARIIDVIVKGGAFTMTSLVYKWDCATRHNVPVKSRSIVYWKDRIAELRKAGFVTLVNPGKRPAVYLVKGE